MAPEVLRFPLPLDTDHVGTNDGREFSGEDSISTAFHVPENGSHLFGIGLAVFLAAGTNVLQDYILTRRELNTTLKNMSRSRALLLHSRWRRKQSRHNEHVTP